MRTTNGNATRLCTIGIRKGKMESAWGSCPKDTTNPNPRVTAETPKGSIRMGSRTRETLFLRFKAKVENNPIRMAITVVAVAKRREFKMALIGGT